MGATQQKDEFVKGGEKDPRLKSTGRAACPDQGSRVYAEEPFANPRTRACWAGRLRFKIEHAYVRSLAGCGAGWLGMTVRFFRPRSMRWDRGGGVSVAPHCPECAHGNPIQWQLEYCRVAGSSTRWFRLRLAAIFSAGGRQDGYSMMFFISAGCSRYLLFNRSLLSSGKTKGKTLEGNEDQLPRRSVSGPACLTR